MRKFIVCSLLLMVGLSVFGQSTNEFKSVSKKSSGTTDLSFECQVVSNATALKSAHLSNHFKLSPKFYKPSSLGDPSIKKIIRSKESGLPVFIEIDPGQLKSTSSLSSEERFSNFFEATKSVTNMANLEEDLIIEKVTLDKLGITHVKSKQHFKGIEIYGAEAVLHLNGPKETFTGRLVDVKSDLEVMPAIDSEEALRFVIQDLKQSGHWRELTNNQKEILAYSTPESDLVIYVPKDQEAELSYEIDIRSNFLETWKYFVDATTGKIIHKFNNTKSDGPAVATGYDLQDVLQTFDTYLIDATYYMINATETMFNPENGEGVIRSFEANASSSDYTLLNSADNTWDNRAAVSMHVSAAKTYKYLENTFGRKSLNHQNGTITGVVNVLNEDGSGMDNAYWSAPIIYFGSGGSAFDNLAGALDVVAHEMGHGVVENTANLEYQGQSGAINETYADIFGAMVDREDWFIGEDITKAAYYPSGTLRDMSDPHNQGTVNDHFWQPNHVSEMYLGEEDRGGVHINSGIGNYAYYLFATAVSKEKAEQVFYRALDNYLTTKSQFIDFRIAVVQAATDLYGEGSAEVTEAIAAFETVGIFEEEQIEYEQEYQVNSGSEYILSYDTNPENSNTLYRSSTSGEDFYELTTTLMKGKVSVVDEGDVAVFVSDDSKIRVIGTDPDNPDEFILSEDEFWDNVAVSKDGNRVACISIEVDTAIYVYDFISQLWAKFHLFNPTTSHSGTDAGGVLYADAIEFDHTGEYLIYDAYNELTITSDDPISYWDIGFLKVWDNEANNFGDGSIEKLYGSLPENVSIGNPVFSKNSPNIIAFDYWDSDSDEYAIIGANLLSGELDVITMNTRIGYPSFSKLDDHISYNAFDTNDDDVIAVIGLASNKISANGEPAVLIADAIWPVYYATGTRGLALAPVSNFTVDIKSGNAPLKVQFIDLSINDPSAWEWTFETGDPATSNSQNPIVSYNSAGLFKVTLTTSNGAGSNTVTKTSYINVTESTGLEEDIKELVSYYPNPVDDILNIKCEQDFNVHIFNMLGKEMINSGNKSQLDISSLNPGIYLLQIDVENKVIYGKIQKN